MPEYLAPGVYVEETSFRAKSLEGVSTSTTAFAGPTRRGPLADTPELITSFPDFERIYGGLEDLASGINYMAHAVRSYFNEGGSRLYVARVFLSGGGAEGGRATSAPMVSGATAPDRARFVARFPGDAGNGRITMREVRSPATGRTMERAPEGTLLRVGGDTAAGPVRVPGGIPPFSVPDGGRLLLTVDGDDAEITFRGSPAEAVAATALPDPVELEAGETTLRLTIDGISQTLSLPAEPLARGDFVTALNQRIRGGYARLTGADDPGDADRLVIGSDRRGSAATVTVEVHSGLGFPAVTSASNTADAANNVGDLGHVTADEIDALLAAADIPARAALSPSSNRLVLSTVASGETASLGIRETDDSVHATLGFGSVAGQPAEAGTPGAEVEYYVKRGNVWTDAEGDALDVSGLDPASPPTGGADFLTLNVLADDRDGSQNIFEELGFDRSHPRWIGSVMAERPSRRADFLENIFALEIGDAVTAFALHDGLLSSDEERVITLSGGDDGAEPTQAAYETGFLRLEALDEISIVAAPGHSAYTDFQGIQGALISHAERRRAYRIAVLDTPPEQAVSEARAVRSRIDSRYAALYFPWVVVSNPLARPGVENVPREIRLPPSGFVCGIYARNDIERGVHKAPANEVVRGALRFETEINFAQQEVLNPIGVNCLRFFPGRGYRVWGARLASSDPEWKYVNVRRYFNYLERSIDNGTQWAVFESNGERLWANIRETVSSFLYNEWRSGALLGSNPKEAFFVRCDRSTMTQNDLDNGRLICLIGVAVLKPAEFVIFRIGQKTADART